MSFSYQIIEELYFTNRNFCSDDYDKVLAQILGYLPGAKVHRYTSTEALNGWEIHPKWNLKSASIRKDGELIFDGTAHPLNVIGLSAPFSGKIIGQDLKKHLHYKTISPLEKEAIPFHFRQFYQPWNRDWGFCVTMSFYESIADKDEYTVEIATEESEGYLDILEFDIKGQSELTFCFVAHLDHPGMANDDLAGCAVGIEFFKKLAETNTKYSYKLLILQEIIGSVYYLENLEPSVKRNLFSGMFLEMLGSDGPLKLQRSFSDNLIDPIAETLLLSQSSGDDIQKVYDFRSLIGNDEIVFESYDIPMCSLSRFPYPQYHTSLDNMDIISAESLDESVVFLQNLIEQIEEVTVINKQIKGLFALSNPKYNLYVDVATAGEHAVGLRRLMDFVFFMRKPYSLKELSKRFELPLSVTLDYLKKCEAKGLVTIE